MDQDLSRLSTPISTMERPLILAADDDEDNLLLLIHTLELFGFTHISTLEGRMVLQLAEIYQPDLILLDIILSDLDGMEVIQQLKQKPRTANIPIVAVTALAGASNRAHILQMGCNDCLSKPYDLEDLEVILQQHLRLPSAF